MKIQLCGYWNNIESNLQGCLLKMCVCSFGIWHCAIVKRLKITIAYIRFLFLLHIVMRKQAVSPGIRGSCFILIIWLLSGIHDSSRSWHNFCIPPRREGEKYKDCSTMFLLRACRVSFTDVPPMQIPRTLHLEGPHAWGLYCHHHEILNNC